MTEPAVGDFGYDPTLDRAPRAATARAAVAPSQAKKTGMSPYMAALQVSPAYIYVKVREEGGATSGPCLGTSYAPYFALPHSHQSFS